MSECSSCGGDVDNRDNGNRPREKCWSCIEETAHTPDDVDYEAFERRLADRFERGGSDA